MAATTPGGGKGAGAEHKIVKQSHDTKGFVVLSRRWMGRHPGLPGLAGTEVRP